MLAVCVVQASGHKITTQIPNIPEFIPDCFLFHSILLSFSLSILSPANERVKEREQRVFSDQSPAVLVGSK